MIKHNNKLLENRDYGSRGFATLITRHPLSVKVGTNFADNLW
jgi:hypothetical protein